MSQWLHKPMYNLRYLAGTHEDRIDCYMRAIDDLFGLSETEAGQKRETEVTQDE